MSMRVGTITIWLLTVTAYVARPWSCMAALQLEVRPPDQPYHSVDPHGFGVLGAIFASLLLMGPVLWLLLQRRPSDVGSTVSGLQATAVMLALATPMLLQLTYLNMPLAWCWPVIAASTVWSAVVLGLCLRTAPGEVSAYGAFDRHPKVAWTLVATIGLSKAAIVALVLV